MEKVNGVWDPTPYEVRSEALERAVQLATTSPVDSAADVIADAKLFEAYLQGSVPHAPATAEPGLGVDEARECQQAFETNALLAINNDRQDEARELCGSCDAGLPMPCGCSKAEPPIGEAARP